MKTKENLEAAFAGESQATQKYLNYAKEAEKEGHPQVARLFRATAEAEMIHAAKHLKALGKVKTTADNLQDAISGETYEFSKMYPEFLATAKAEDDKAAIAAFNFANEAEKVHAVLYKDALDMLGKSDGDAYFLCETCGYIAKGTAQPDRCPLCQAKGFKKF